MRKCLLLVLLLLAGLLSFPRAQTAGKLNVDGRGLGEHPANVTDRFVNPFLVSNRPRLADFVREPECPFVDSLECVARDLAGQGAVNCGRVRIGMDPTLAGKCALKAFSEKKPFRVRYDLPGWNSENAIGFIGVAAGRVIKVEWGKATGSWWPSDSNSESEHVSLLPCVFPTLLEAGTKGPIECRPLFTRMYRNHWPGVSLTEAKVNPADWQ
jgi:hypothetical protein